MDLSENLTNFISLDGFYLFIVSIVSGVITYYERIYLEKLNTLHGFL